MVKKKRVKKLLFELRNIWVIAETSFTPVNPNFFYSEKTTNLFGQVFGKLCHLKEYEDLKTTRTKI